MWNKGLRYKELAVNPSSELIGKTLLDRYEIQELVGEGGVSRVYRAVDNILKRSVAVKILTNSLQSDELAAERFLREARLTSGLSHPHILPVFDFGRYDDNPFIVCQYHTGVSLQDWLFSNIDMPAATAVKLFIQIASGLAHAHDCGILHRDLKPNNIMLTDGTDGPVATIIDFGLSLEVNQSNPADKLTINDAILGTPCYVSPEQCLGKVATPQSDVYSLGCLMYETLVGTPPFCGETALETMHMHLSSEVRPMEHVRPDIVVPELLQMLVLACLAKNPANRPDGMREVIDALKKIRDSAVLPSLGAADNKLRNEALLANKKLNSKSNTTADAPPVTPPAERAAEAVNSKFYFRIPLALAIALASCGLAWMTFAQSGQMQKAGNNAPAVDVVQANSGIVSGPATVNNPQSSKTDLEGEPDAAKAPALAETKEPAEAAKSKAALAAEDNPEKLAELAAECHARGDCDDAVTLLQKSVKVSQRIFGPKSQQTRQRLKDLAVLHMALGNQTEANHILKELGSHKNLKSSSQFQ